MREIASLESSGRHPVEAMPASKVLGKDQRELGGDEEEQGASGPADSGGGGLKQEQAGASAEVIEGGIEKADDQLRLRRRRAS